ncbi:MAG TPA: hypothetical protein VMW95_03575 [Desulfobacterales bacterium]|nr:hypothetical protein [Desulfobacterales bacterium]
MSKLDDLIKEEYKTLSEALDKKYDYFKKLREFKEKHGCVPAEHQKAWDNFLARDAGLLWSEQKRARKSVMKAAKIHALRRLKA